MKQYIDQKTIIEFVKAVEKKKKYRRDAGLVLRHLFEEVGECSANLWKYEKSILDECPSDIVSARLNNVARELVDIISIVVLLADILKIDLNESIPWRVKEVNEQYGVK